MLMIYASVIDDAAELRKFEKIFYAYRDQMFFIANKILNDEHEAEDAVQNAFMGIAQNIKSLPTDDKRVVRAYTLTAAKNAALNLLPQKQRRDMQLDIDEVDIADDEDVFKRVAASEDREMISRAIEKLPDIYGDVLLMHCVCGLGVERTALMLGRKKATVEKQLTRARKLVAKLCIEEGMVFEHGENNVGV